MKLKHRQLKTVGRNKTSGGSSTKRVKRTTSIKNEHKITNMERVMVLDFTNGRKGKVSWQLREKSGK